MMRKVHTHFARKRNCFKFPSFEFIYMFVMIVYMAQMNETTARMVGGLSGNPIPFLVPIVLTAVLLIRHPISFRNRYLWLILGIFLIWGVLVLASVGGLTNMSDWSYMFFVFYPILIAYIHIKVFGRHLFFLYEKIMVLICKISIPFWILNILFFNVFEPSFLQETSVGYNCLFLYNWASPDNGIDDMFLLTLRNSGFSWEPGRFAIMIVLALLFNLSRKGVRFVGNSNALWLLAALLSTQSTTGLLIGIVLYAMFLFKFRFKNIAMFFLILIPVVFALLNLDFMYDKITEQLGFQYELPRRLAEMKYNTDHTAEGEYLYSVSRFESMFFDSINMLDKPLLGYSTNVRHSFFYDNISSNYSLPSGLIKIPAQYGIPVGLLIFAFLFVSSKSIALHFREKKQYAFFFLILMSLVSYDIWRCPIYTAFWLYGIFYQKKKRARLQNDEKIRFDNSLK